MTPAIVSAVAGTSGLIGLLALLAFLFYNYQVRKMEQSVRRTIEGESPGLFNASQVSTFCGFLKHRILDWTR